MKALLSSPPHARAKSFFFAPARGESDCFANTRLFRFDSSISHCPTIVCHILPVLSLTPRPFPPHERLQTCRCQQNAQRAARASDDSKPGCICQFMSLNVLGFKILTGSQKFQRHKICRSRNGNRQGGTQIAIDLSVKHRHFEHFSIFVVPNVGFSLTLSAAVCSPLPAR